MTRSYEDQDQLLVDRIWRYGLEPSTWARWRGDAVAAIGREHWVRERLKTATLVDVTPVADWVMQQDAREYYHWSRDFPCLRPQYPVMWIEFKAPVTAWSSDRGLRQIDHPIEPWREAALVLDLDVSTDDGLRGVVRSSKAVVEALGHPMIDDIERIDPSDWVEWVRRNQPRLAAKLEHQSVDEVLLADEEVGALRAILMPDLFDRLEGPKQETDHSDWKQLTQQRHATFSGLLKMVAWMPDLGTRLVRAAMPGLTRLVVMQEFCRHQDPYKAHLRPALDCAVSQVLPIDDRGRLVGPPLIASHVGDAIIDRPTNRTMSDGHRLTVGEATVDSAKVVFWIVGMAISLLHARNVAIEQQPPKPLVDRSGNERSDVKAGVRYHTLKVYAPNVDASTVADRPGTGPRALPFHTVRGHFADYRERGLFGRYKTLIWRQAHWRGDKAHGEVDKDYQVIPTTPDPVASIAGGG